MSVEPGNGRCLPPPPTDQLEYTSCLENPVESPKVSCDLTAKHMHMHTSVYEYVSSLSIIFSSMGLLKMNGRSSRFSPFDPHQVDHMWAPAVHLPPKGGAPLCHGLLPAPVPPSGVRRERGRSRRPHCLAQSNRLECVGLIYKTDC